MLEFSNITFQHFHVIAAFIAVAHEYYCDITYRIKYATTFLKYSHGNVVLKNSCKYFLIFSNHIYFCNNACDIRIYYNGIIQFCRMFLQLSPGTIFISISKHINIWICVELWASLMQCWACQIIYRIPALAKPRTWTKLIAFSCYLEWLFE